MPLAHQNSVLPTNKLLVSHLVGIAMFHYGVDATPLPPEIIESYKFVISAAVAVVAGWLTPDFLNYPNGRKHLED